MVKKSTPPPPVVEKGRTQSPAPLLERIQPVTSGSNITLEDLPAGPSLEDRLSSPLVECQETPLHTTEKKKRVRKPKKDKKEQKNFPKAVSKTQLYLEYEALNNTQPNFGNLVAKNGAPLFVEPVQNHNNPFNNNKVNPEHPCAPFYQRLMDSLKQENQDSAYDPYLDDVTDNHKSSSEDEKEVDRKCKKLNKFLKQKAPTNPSGIHYTEEDF